MDGPVSIFFSAAINVGLACIVAFGLFRLIAGNGKVATAIDYGRKWLAWVVFACTATTLPKFFRKLDTDSFFAWLAVTITLGIVAFVVGSFYGKYFKQEKGKSLKTKEKQTGVNSVLSSSMIRVSEKAIPFNPTTQRQDKTDHTQTDIITQKTIPTIATQKLPKADLGDEAFYEKAFNELESEDRKVGLWGKVFAEAQGNESLAKANYLKIRSGQLANEHKQSLLEEERQLQEEKKIAEMESGRITSPTLGAKFVLIHAGTFMMGSPSSEKGRGNDEKQHQVSISKPFYMQTTPVTQGQWQRMMGNNPSEFGSCGNDCPVENVSWNDVQKFIRILNQMEGADKYRLPTEAEWEYAARAGTTTRFYSGDNDDALSRDGWYLGNSESRPNPVGQKTPNAYGLYDMHGNVYEWVKDSYGNYPSDSVTDPEGPASGSFRINRGGSWRSPAGSCRSAYRDYNGPGFQDYNLGFRLVRTC
jgi:formylglycine-generating enzyme required for sulfatase activity